MRLHIFNPEHDIALAYDKKHFTLPHNISEFRMNLGFLPALWASDGDIVLVDDIAFSVKAAAQVGVRTSDVLFLSDGDLKDAHITSVDVWGWDKAVRARLLDAGVDAGVMPSEEELSEIRRLSGRQLTTDVLAFVRDGIEDVTCGESHYVTSLDDVGDMARAFGSVVVKSPWSSSGRGVRYISCNDMSAPVAGWISKAIKSQGGVMVEPCYSRVKDFAMEFVADADGGVEYCGLSLFNTEKGNYTGNIIATEKEKHERMRGYLAPDVFTAIKNRLVCYFSKELKGRYEGPFGVDMMVVAKPGGNGFLIHPCVEVNLRRTMGHVANSFVCTDEEPVRAMRIYHDVNYKFRVGNVDLSFVKTV